MRVLAGRGLLFAVLAAGCRHPPDGVSQIDLGEETHGHQYDARAGKLLYIQGEYPHKTYFGVYDLTTGKVSKKHFADYRLVDSDFVYLPKADEAVLAARYRAVEDAGAHVYMRNTDGNLLNFSGQEGEKVKPDRLLHVSLLDGSLLGEMALAQDTVPVEIARPSWSDKIFIVLKTEEKTLLKLYDPGKRAANDSITIGDFVAQGAAFLDRSPLLLLSVKDSLKKPRLITYDLTKMKVLMDLPHESGLDEIQSYRDFTLARHRLAGELKTVVARLDFENGSIRALATIENDVESMLLASDRVCLISQDITRRGTPDGRGLAPRFFTLLNAQAPFSRDSITWTNRAGRLFGYDQKNGRLFFAAAQPASVWMIAADKQTLSQAAGEIDRKTGQMLGRQVLMQTYLIAGCAVMGGLMMLMYKNSESTDS